MTIDIYPTIVHELDLSPGPFGSEIDDICDKILKATKGWGTDEKGLVRALATQDQETRTKVSIRYPEMHGKELVKIMKSECGSGDFGTALQFLAVPPDVAECMMIERACRGIGTNELILYPIVCGRSNKEIEILKKAYFKFYTKDLISTIASELSGDLEKVVINCLQASEEEYDPGYHTEDKAKEDAEAIYKMGQGRLGTDEVSIFKILAAAPAEHLKAINLVYAEKYGYTLFKALEKELGGKVEDAAMHMIGMKLRPYETVAKLLDKAMRGFGTNELLLTCTVLRYQSILKDVEAAHQELFGQGLVDRIRKEVSGDYEDLLVEACSVAL